MKRPLTARTVAALAVATAGFVLLAYGDFVTNRTLRAAGFAAIALAVMLVLFDARSTR